MIYVTGRTDFKIEEKTAITLGKFDGIHKGHQVLIQKILSKKNVMKTVVFTFDMNPNAAISRINETLITTNEERRQVVEALGVDYLYECSFTDEIRNCEARDFVRKICKELNIGYIAVGKDFKFGHNRAGDYRLLEEMSRECGYEIDIINKEQYQGRDISSTYVREKIAEGDLDTVNKLLGYTFSISGKVSHGRKLGRTIGIPTTNLIPEASKLLPPNGVYVSKAIVDGIVYKGVTNIGVKPTVSGDNIRTVETHIFDFDQDVYSKYIKIELYHFLRSEKKFSSVDELKKQMESDIICTKSYQI